MTEQIIAIPWRDGTLGGNVSADLFDGVVTRLLHDAPESTQAVKGSGAGVFRLHPPSGIHSHL